MTREKALEAMDKFVAMGYGVTLAERDLGDHGHVFVGADGEMTSITRHLEISELSVDKIDLRAIVAAADELELDVGFSPIQGGRLSLTDMPTEDDKFRQQFTGKRKNPR